MARNEAERLHDTKHVWIDARRESGRRSMSATWTENRRKAPRIAARGVASHVQTDETSTPGLVVENISMNGLFIRSANAIKLGTPVMLQLLRPGLRRAIQLTGIVVSIVTPAEARRHGRAPGLGISLDPVEGEAAQRLRSLIDDLVRSVGEPARVARAAAIPTVPAPAVVAEESRRVEQLEAEVTRLRQELLRRNRTIGELANKLAKMEGSIVRSGVQ